MYRRNLCIFIIIIFALICPLNSVSSSNKIIEESEDYIGDIPSPTELHNIEKLVIEPCNSSNRCSLNSSYSNFNEIRASFNSSDDRDVFWFHTNSTENIVVYEVCINNSSVPLLIQSYKRNSINPSLSSLDIEGNLISDTPATNLICKKYPPIDESNSELWIKVSTLSTSGNYSLVIKSHPVQLNGQSFNERKSYFEFSNDGSSANSSLGITRTIMINHSISEGQFWELQLIANTPHKVISICHYNDLTKSICFEKNSTKVEELHEINYEYYAPKNIEYIEVNLETQSWFIKWNIKNKLQNLSDPFMHGNQDAPGNLSHLQCEEKCPEFIGNTGLTYSGTMPLSIFDEADVWEIKINGSEYDTFFIEINIKCEPYSIVLELHFYDNNGNSNLTYIVPDTSNWNTLQAEIPSGTHYIRLISTNAGNVRDWEYGDLNKSNVNYELKVKWIKNQTDFNLTYEVSEELLFWDRILVWFIGICMTLPMIWVLFNLKRDRAKMKLLLHDENRLGRLRKLTSKSEIIEAKEDLKLFINSITNLDWDILLKNWGIPDLSYVSESITVNTWKLDKKIANNNGLPLLIIIETHVRDWEIAALKFESSHDSDWGILSLQPNLLFRNNEIFLDTIKVGNKITIKVEVSGICNDLQINISGMAKGKPVAIKTPNSIIFEEEE